MTEQDQLLLKELLQKKLHNTLTVDEEVILNSLVAKKTGRTPSAPEPLSNLSMGLSALDNLMNSTDSLNSTLEEMSGKVNNKVGQAEAKQAIAEEDQKTKQKKGWFNW